MVDLRATNQKLQDRSERILMETLDLNRRAAAYLLGRAGGSVKTAMVMQWRGVDAEKAAKLLQRAGGRLGEILGQEQPK